jgi:hypothetical protein
MTMSSKTKKQIFFAHSGGAQGHGKGRYDLVDYLRTQLGNKFNIQYPIIENPEAPTYAMWKTMLKAKFYT